MELALNNFFDRVVAKTYKVKLGRQFILASVKDGEHFINHTPIVFNSEAEAERQAELMAYYNVGTTYLVLEIKNRVTNSVNWH